MSEATFERVAVEFFERFKGGGSSPELHILVLNEVQRDLQFLKVSFHPSIATLLERQQIHLWEPFLLQIRNNALTQQSRSPNDRQHLPVINASLRRYSVGSKVIVLGRAERSRQWAVLPVMRVR
jgi:hypothetical protein